MDRSAAGRLVDWGAAARLGSRVAGAGPPLRRSDWGALREDFADVVAEAEGLITDFTGLRLDGPPTRPWVMTRTEWIRQNLRGFETVLQPLAHRVVGRGREGPLGAVRRKALAAQAGGLLGYLSRKVLGQYDLFLPPDDREVLYFVGPNVVAVERKFRFRGRDFRLWLCLHEVVHRVQFAGVPWLRDHVMGLIEEYVRSVELDPRKLIDMVRRARDEARRGVPWQGMGVVFLLMTPEQRDVFTRMQAVMSLLEGHGNYVMHRLSRDAVPGAERMRRALDRRRRGLSRTFQRAIGLEAKIRQYGHGERFVARVVDAAGMEGFSRVWERPEHLPSLAEVGRPERWVERVAAS